MTLNIAINDEQGKIIVDVTWKVKKDSVMQLLVIALEKTLPLIIERVIREHKRSLKTEKQVKSTVH